MKHLFTLCLCIFCLPIVLAGLPCPLQAEEKVGNIQEDTPTREATEASLIDLFSWAGVLPKELIDLQERIESFQDIEIVEKQLPQLEQGIKDLQWEVSLLGGTSLGTQVVQVDPYELRLSRFKYQLTKLSHPITQVIAELSLLHKKWAAKKQTLAEFKKQAELPLSYFIEEKNDVADTISVALQLIEKQLSPTLTLGKKIAALQVEVYLIESSLRKFEAELRKSSTQQTSPSMLSAEFYTRLNMQLVKDSYTSIRSFIILQAENLKDKYSIALFGCIGFALLYGSIRWTYTGTPAASHWRPFAACPLATATFIVSVSSSFFAIMLGDLELPEQWVKLLHILNILAVARLLNHIVEAGWRLKRLRRLVFFLAFTLLLIAVGFPQMLIFIYAFYVSIVALIVYVYQLRRTTDTGNSMEMWIHRTWGLLPMLILLSGITGYDQFAIFFFAACLSTIVAFLIIWMLFRFNVGLLDLACSLLPFALVRNNQSTILKSLRPLIVLVHLLLLLLVFGVIWGGQKTAGEVIAIIGDFGFDLGDVRISPGFVMVVALVFYVTILVSRAVQAMLLKEVLPRYDADKGVQMSISRLVHYAVLTGGFFVMLRVLGFKIEQLALLGGAFGLGISFGLQAIINNFACGVILLFERPIKVGDTIQIGDEFGEVKGIGLRSTIIRTFDNADIVVPNSDLVTGQVVNWTLANRKVRVRVPVGVAYGSEVNKVLEILRGCAEANPMVLNTPKPLAFFLAFGPSSLDFELRVWIPDFLEKTQVLSDLNQDIEAEFASNNIEIPFPQSDLHIRSVDEKAATILHAGPG